MNEIHINRMYLLVSLNTYRPREEGGGGGGGVGGGGGGGGARCGCGCPPTTGRMAVTGSNEDPMKQQTAQHG